MSDEDFRHIRLEHKTQVHRLKGLKELNRLRKLEHARPVSANKVKELLAVLQQGKPLRGVYVVNNVSDGRGERYRLLDGNHRLTAYLMFAEEHPLTEFELEFHVYDHLGEAEEFRLFEEYNNVRKVTVTQIIGVEREIIPIAGLMEKRRGFPCNVYFDRCGPKGEGVVFQKLAFAYLTRLNSSHGSWDARMLEQVKALDERDYAVIKTFIEDIIPVFGAPAFDNLWLQRQAVLTTIARVYFCNVPRLGRQEVLRRLKAKVLQNASVLAALALVKGSPAHAGRLNEAIVDACNIGFAKPESKFVMPDEYAAILKVGEGGGKAKVEAGGNGVPAGRESAEAA